MRKEPGRALHRSLIVMLALAAVLAALAAGVAAQPSVQEWGVPTGSSQPHAIASDSAGNLWFTELAGNKLARVNQNGAIQEFTIPTDDSQPWGIAVDGSGRIWFTAFNSNKIGNMTPGGLFGQDNIPTSDSRPRGIAVDSSGNVWFAESAANRIGRFIPSNNTFEERTIPTNNSEPWGVALDSAGNIWFTEFAGNKIGRMTQSGQFTEYSLPSGDSGPTGIAVDASGNVWFAENKGNRIGMMTPSGAFTEYQIPISNSQPTFLAIDRQGGVWYAGSNSNTFGRVYNGSVVEYGLPTPGSQPWGIAIDPSGNVWITERSANRVARATGAAPVATATPVVPTATPAPPQPTPTAAPRDSRYFTETGFRVDNDVFWDYFNKRGGIRTFGYPVSRTFPFLGFTTQFFQRGIMQLSPEGTARTMNMLDPGLMPYTRINGSTFPAPDVSLANEAPAPGTADYAARVQEFIMKYAPNQFEGRTVNFYQAFNNTVTLQDAWPNGDGNPALLPGLNLELWGVPTSRPAYDPNNRNFVYLRFQRGIMHFDATNGYTQGLLLADYLKSIITGSNLPPDLDEQARGSDFYKQYNRDKPNWVDRPERLPGTNLFYAFERQ